MGTHYDIYGREKIVNDTTLTVEDMPADAASVGDRIRQSDEDQQRQITEILDQIKGKYATNQYVQNMVHDAADTLGVPIKQNQDNISANGSNIERLDHNINSGLGQLHNQKADKTALESGITDAKDYAKSLADGINGTLTNYFAPTLNSKAPQAQVNQISSDVYPHIHDANIHVTAEEKAKWNAGGGSSYDDTEIRAEIASNNVFVVSDVNQNEDVRDAVVATAKTYRDAQDAGTVFKYVDGHGCLKPLASNENLADVHDDNGANIIDCSTYIGLVLRGYNYSETHYATSSLKRINPKNCKFGTGFAEREFDLQNRYSTGLTYNYFAESGEKRILTAADIARFYAEQGRLISMEDTRYTLQKGDIVFFAAPADSSESDDSADKGSQTSGLRYPNRFLGISHVGIMYSANYYYNATKTASGVEGIVQSSVSGRRPMCYARPAYGYEIKADLSQLQEEVDGKVSATEVPTIVKSTLTSTTATAWTESEQAAAQARLGIYPMAEEGY